MIYLLDTQVFLWMQASPERLGETARQIIDDAGNQLLLSAASSWEIAIKHAIGKLHLPEPPEDYVPRRMTSSALTPLPVQHSHALRVSTMDSHHRDPFDRLLVAQAQLEGVALISADAIFRRYDVELIDAE
jgi:PIN domain nuclease of toxin-antitoxin system